MWLKHQQGHDLEEELDTLDKTDPIGHSAVGMASGETAGVASIGSGGGPPTRQALIVDRDGFRQPYEVFENVPVAYPQLRVQLRKAALSAMKRYLVENREQLPRTMYSEQVVRVHVAPGVVVDGRIDLIRRLDTDKTSIVDFKPTERAQAEEITLDQLHVYAVG